MLQLAFAIYDIVSHFILTAFCPISLSPPDSNTSPILALYIRYCSVNSKRAYPLPRAFVNSSRNGLHCFFCQYFTLKYAYFDSDLYVYCEE